MANKTKAQRRLEAMRKRLTKQTQTLTANPERSDMDAFTIGANFYAVEVINHALACYERKPALAYKADAEAFKVIAREVSQIGVNAHQYANDFLHAPEMRQRAVGAEGVQQYTLRLTHLGAMTSFFQADRVS